MARPELWLSRNLTVGCYLPPFFQKSLSQACLSPELTGTLAMGSGCIGPFTAVPLLSTAVAAIFFATTAEHEKDASKLF